MAVEDDAGAGFVITHIPKSYLAPHQCLRPIQYYMRAGSNFEPVPHGVLAGMFGRAPQPVIFHMWGAPPAELRSDGSAFFRIGLLLTNRSPAIARDVYLSVTIFPPGANNRVAMEFPDLQNWSANQAFGCITQILAKENFQARAPGRSATCVAHVLSAPAISGAPAYEDHNWMLGLLDQRILSRSLTGTASRLIRHFHRQTSQH